MRPLPLLSVLLVLSPPVQAQVYEAQLRWEVGAANGVEWEIWMQVKDAVLWDSTVFVLDSKLPVLRQFKMNGEYLGDIGGSGGGPGEFAAPGSLEPFSEGFSVCDQLQGRITDFGGGGAVARTITIPFPPNRAWRVAGGWNVGFYVQPARGDSSTVSVWQDDDSPSSLVKIENAFVQIQLRGGGVFLPSIGVVGGVNGGATVLGDSVLVLVDKNSVLRALRPHGTDWVETLRDTLPVQRERLLESDHDSVLAIFLAAYENDPRLVDPEFPEYWPTWIHVQGTSAGVWMKEGGREGSMLGRYPERWWLWRPDMGAELGAILPTGTQALRFVGTDFVIAKRKDEFDVEVLQFFDLVPKAH